MAPEEKRTHPRQEKNYYVAAKVFEGTTIKDDTPFGLLQELSLGGCLLLLPYEIETGTEISVHIGFGEHIETFTGEVVHGHKNETGKGYFNGLKFSTLNLQQEQIITNILGGNDISPLGEWHSPLD